ncbi:SgrR family transcriptional regulator [Brevibacillus migulae]|uniref:SgrR family transcriptional regulator n=1 Tax=Brevibacillus migulae TaxID=1644114 RepID=UPI00106E69B7|nr:SgrR family transcriptional regulator [Brevibacillus migulae]
MKSTEHYLSILLSFPMKQAKGEIVSITIEELTDILYCTPRNVKLIIRKLADEKYIEWRAGVGRGNPSQMTLLKDLDDVADEYFHDLLVKDKIKEAMDLLYHKALPLPLRNKLRGLLDARFGFQVELTSFATTDFLRVTMNRKSNTLDPAFVCTATAAFILQQICDGLVSYDSEKKTYVPALAHSWESNEDGSRWTFYLRKGVRFHHGRPLTSKDVFYTFQRLKDVHSPSRWQYEEIERVEIVSDHVISFYLRQPNRLFLHFFGSFYMSILPHDVAFSERAIIGTGPFRMAESTDQVIVLEAYEDYFQERALLDRVELWLIPEDVPIEQYQLPQGDDIRQDANSTDGEIGYVMDGCQFIVFNFKKKGIHHNRSFRKAMRILFDRLAIIRELKENRIAPADSFLPDKSSHVHFAETTLEEALAYLRESGYSGETLNLFYLEKKDFLVDAQWLQQRCEAVRLYISLHPIPFADYYSPTADQEADMLLICETLEDDVEWGYLRLFQDEASFLHRFFHHEQHGWLDGCFRRFVQLPTSEQRERIIDEVERRIREEDWILFGYHINKVSRYHPALNGVSLDSFGWIDFSKLWIKQGIQV